jgi:hypothetical protein
MSQFMALFVAVAACFILGCGNYEPAAPVAPRAPASPPMTGGSASGPTAGAGPQAGPAAPQGASPMPFLDQKKQVPPQQEWTREIASRRGGTISFRVTSQGPFAVTLVTGRGYQALVNGAALSKEDGLLSLDCKGPSHEGKVTVPPGSSWFILENHTNQAAEMHLECFAAE